MTFSEITIIIVIAFAICVFAGAVLIGLDGER